MTAAELAAVIACVAALAVVGVGVVLVMTLRRTIDDLSAAVSDVRNVLDDETARLAGRIDHIDAELARADGLLESAETITARADTLSRVTYGAVAKPVIKTAAVVKGTSKAARLLRRGGDELDERAG